MPKYWGKQVFSLGSFPEVGQKQKTEKKERKKKIERLNDGNNNGQLCIANARKAAWAKMASFASVRHDGCRTQAGWINK